jgi:heme-degrading monooxygenase HmoA
MFARVTTLEGPPEQIDEALRHVQERVLPRIRQYDGYNGFIVLGDRQAGRVLGLTLWGSEQALRSTEQEATRLRRETSETVGQAVAGVESYEVPLLELRLVGGEQGEKGVIDVARDRLSGR